DLLDWEEANGPLPEGAIVLFRTGFDQYWPDRAAYLGTDKRGAKGVAELHFPGLSEELAQFLVEERDVAAVGLDTASLDYGQAKDFIAHRILLGENIPGFENVTNLGSLPARGAYVIALPVKIRGGSGGPLRIVAVIPPGPK
ncbi:MAG: cyclase family protein, partial [Sphingomonadales bacterium]